MQEKLEGVVNSVVFQSEEGGFCVFRLNTVSGTTVVVMNSIAPLLGEEVQLIGQWVTHSKFGKQFKAISYTSITENSNQGIARFLGSGAVKGIGKAMAARIVAHFGEDTLTIMNERPHRLTEINGIGQKKAQAIYESYSELAESRELMLFLEEHGVSANYATKLQVIYGISAIDLIKKDPYRLAYEVDGIGFRIADRIARSMGIAANDERRLKAGFEFALQQIAQSGHVCIPKEALENHTAKLLEIERIDVIEVLKVLLEDNFLRTEDFSGQCLIYPEYLYQAEVSVAKRLLYLKDRVKKLSFINTDSIVDIWENTAGIKLAKVQRQAVDAVLEHGILVVTGGPGTGKTTLIKGIISVLEAAGCRILLAAPTGRAARRLAESAGRPALTVHRMLEYVPHEGRFAFGRNEDQPLDADTIIIDEASMLDMTLTSALLKAIPTGCRLIFIGDIDQLPAVGPGSVLKDIIRSNAIQVVRLNEVFRQAAQSKIVLNAHAINRGLLPEIEPDSEFEFFECTDEMLVAQKIVDFCETLLEEYNLHDLQILSPMHKLPCGVENLNKLLQERFNPPDEFKQEVNTARQILREGDKIIQVRNNYDKEVFNGDIGWVSAVHGRTLTAYFPDINDGLTVKYEQGEFDELQLAYAMSVHKAQGSEYPVVVLALSKGHYIFLQRNLLYTAITRAREKVVIVGQKSSLQTAVINDKTRRRYSLLAERLQEVDLS